MSEQLPSQKSGPYFALGSLCVAGTVIASIYEVKSDPDYGWAIAVGAGYAGYLLFKRGISIVKTDLLARAQAEGSRLQSLEDQNTDEQA